MGTVMMEASVRLGLDGSQLASQTSSTLNAMGQKIDAFGTQYSAKLLNPNIVKQKMQEITEIIAAAGRQSGRESIIAKMMGISDTEPAIERIKQQAKRLHDEIRAMDTERAKLRTGLGAGQSGDVYGPFTAEQQAEAAVLKKIEAQRKAHIAVLRELADEKRQIDHRQANLDHEMADPKSGINQKLLADEKAADLEKQRMSVANKARQLDEDATRKRNIASMTQEAAATQLYSRLMAQPAAIPPRMDGVAGRGGGAGTGGKHGNYSSGLIQLSYGLQDLGTVMGAGGSFQQGMVAMSNNLGAMVTMAGGANAAFGGLAITLGALALPKIVEWMSSLWKETDHTAESVRGLRMSFEQFGRSNTINVGVQGLRAGLHADLDEVRKLKGGSREDQESSKHGFRGFAKSLDAEEKRMKVDDAKAKAELDASVPRLEDIDKKLNKSKLAKENIANRGMTFAKGLGIDVPEHAGVTDKDVLSDEEEKVLREQRETLSKETDAARRILEEDTRKRKVIANARKHIAKDLADEEAKNQEDENAKLRKRLDHKQEETGNEFKNRRNRIFRDIAEEQAEINKSQLPESEKRQRIQDSVRRGNMAAGDVKQDEQRARNRFMRGLESRQQGTGAVHAVEDRLAEDLERAERLFGKGTPEYQRAERQAVQTAGMENRRILDANRTKGGDWIGIEDLSKTIQSSLLKDNPDEKAIRVATEASAKALEAILQKKGFAMGVGP